MSVSWDENMTSLIITCDLDWAPEYAITKTLEFIDDAGIKPTVFITHESKAVMRYKDKIDVALHPFFDVDSSHGNTIDKTIQTMQSMQYTVPGFRCHRFKSCNQSMQAMYSIGMRFSSNVCTDLHDVAPFVNRYGMIEFPVFFEDGGYLWRRHSLSYRQISNRMNTDSKKIILVHPMHFILNSPNFEFMQHLKASYARDHWINMGKKELEKLRYQGYGIGDFVVDMLSKASSFDTLKDYYNEMLTTQYKDLLLSGEHSLL